MTLLPAFSSILKFSKAMLRFKVEGKVEEMPSSLFTDHSQAAWAKRVHKESPQERSDAVYAVFATSPGSKSFISYLSCSASLLLAVAASYRLLPKPASDITQPRAFTTSQVNLSGAHIHPAVSPQASLRKSGGILDILGA